MNIITDPDQNFTCQMCGECCGKWYISIEEEKYNKLREQDWVKNLLTQTQTDFFKYRNDYFLPKKDDQCVFLNENKTCMLHETGLKPGECERFPFSYSRYNDKIYVDTSLYCKATIENTGISLQQYSKTLNTGQLTLFTLKKEVKDLVIENYTTHLPTLKLAFMLEKRSPKTDFWKILFKRGVVYDPLLDDLIDQRLLHPVTVDTLHPLLMRYMKNLTLRKSFYAFGYREMALKEMVKMAYLLTIYYAKAVATLLKQNHAETFHIQQAIRIVERYYISHNPDFLETYFYYLFNFLLFKAL